MFSTKDSLVTDPYLFNTPQHDHPGTELLDTLPTAVYLCDKLGYVTSFNKAAAALWGRTPEPGKDLWCGSWKIFKPNGEPIRLDQCPMARALKEGKPIEGEEIIIERPDGIKLNVLPYPVPLFDKDGALTGAINTLVDITGRKSTASEKNMMAAIVRSSDDAIVSKTLEGIVTSWNDAAEHIFGYTANEMIGRSITTLIPQERLQEEDMILTKLRNGEKVDHYETWRLRKDGVQIPVSLTISPIKDENGIIVGASKIARDISRQKAFEDKLRRYTENIEIFNTIGKVVSENLDIESIVQKVTDITTQLTGAAFGAFFYNKLDEKGESYMLYTLSGAPHEAFEKFDMTRNSAIFNPTFKGHGIVRSDDITKDPRYGKNHPHYGMPKGHLPVVSYLAAPVISKNGSVIGGLFYGHPEPGKFTDEHEMLLSGIASQAGMALDNARLLGNAVKYSPKSAVVNVVVSVTANQQARISVQDFGMGINKEQQKKIFSRFYRVDELDAHVSGLGLGLYISKEIIDRHGGKLTVESVPGKGSTFSFELSMAGAAA